MPERLTIPLRPKTRAGKVDRRYASRTEDMMQLEFTDEFLDFLDLVKDSKTNPLGQLDIGVVWSSIEDRLDEFLLPFAAVFPGDFLCFDFTKSDEPTVVLWVHDKSDEGAPHTVRVAKNFRAFVGMLFDASAPRSRRS